MNHQVLESFLKNALTQYREQYQAMNKGKEIDFSIDFFETKLNPFDVAEKQGLDTTNMINQTIQVTYCRIVKVVKGDEPRVIFANYLPNVKGRKPQETKEMLLKESIRHFIIGGVEYAEAMYLYQVDQEGKGLQEADKKEEVADGAEVESK